MTALSKVSLAPTLQIRESPAWGTRALPQPLSLFGNAKGYFSFHHPKDDIETSGWKFLLQGEVLCLFGFGFVYYMFLLTSF